ncbi:MAG: peptidylprolyl isomerase [Nitrospirota bacterium]
MIPGHRRRRRPRLLGASGWLLLLLASAAAHAATDRLVAVVNDEIITESELEGSRALASLDLLSDILPGLQHTVSRPTARTALEALIDQRLLLREAEALGVSATKDEARGAVQSLREQHRLDELAGAADEDIEHRVQEQLTIVKLVNREVRSKILLNAADVDAYYREHADRFTRPGRYRIRQIFIKSSSDDAPARAAAHAQAEALRAEAAAGADFGELARRASHGAEAAHGGDLGYVQRGDLLPEIDAVLDRLGVGEVSPVLATALGFHVINVVQAQPPTPRPLEDVKPQIEELVYQEQATDYYRRWIRLLRGRSHIDIKL